MKVLSFDTSSPACASAVVEVADGACNLLAEINVWAPRGHMAKLLPQIEMTLSEAGVVKGEIGGIIVGIGPGSFTGLRIGVTIARTLAQLLVVPIAGIPSLDAMARKLIAFPGLICPVIDAKRGEVYTAFYESTGERTRRTTDFRPMTPGALAEDIAKTGFDLIVFTGDGVGAYEDLLAERLGDRAVFMPKEYWWPLASDLAFTGAHKLETEPDDLFSLIPLYARLSQAEELWLKRGEHA
ncbi:MAG: tRNA (adenosine(37)-N6)-threonylcarbamoyltransferase complex dimerization subunit type 1 TsaB [Chloroflexi bacterium]|nr:tRNA (adenosine(37)-N6)-threonylcarbamoyltransferase complex dimerization subunit type 1 TsaB [Chloroflexota bacterium]